MTMLRNEVYEVYWKGAYPLIRAQTSDSGETRFSCEPPVGSDRERESLMCIAVLCGRLKSMGFEPRMFSRATTGTDRESDAVDSVIVREVVEPVALLQLMLGSPAARIT